MSCGSMWVIANGLECRPAQRHGLGQTRSGNVLPHAQECDFDAFEIRLAQLGQSIQLYISLQPALVLPLQTLLQIVPTRPKPAP